MRNSSAQPMFSQHMLPAASTLQSQTKHIYPIIRPQNQKRNTAKFRMRPQVPQRPHGFRTDFRKSELNWTHPRPAKTRTRRRLVLKSQFGLETSCANDLPFNRGVRRLCRMCDLGPIEGLRILCLMSD
ncbi:uncharacterized protein LOC117643459 [Thrips palmi]|uniref:Uncharacterized protein LOC117643459 n=1 Tax=Thrips palmi TaxID=161013 RepID=A0A6P8YN54_THRPL|nr:uncharacterized protein LOC117643459 [Thrips palmi]